MTELIHSAEFWFGAIVLCIYQVAKFSEVNALDPSLSARSATIPNLRASDFTGRPIYLGTLVAFLATTFLAYLVLCRASPSVLTGWFKITGEGGDASTLVDSVPYPLYIAAAFMGLTRPAISRFADVGSMQRNLFHACIGVPRRVVDAASFFSNQILDRSPERQQLSDELARLLGDRWRMQIDAYADTVFYRAQISRLSLDEEAEVKELASGSMRELKYAIEQLVYAAALATVRESGGRNLNRLAADLLVEALPASSGFKDLLVGMIFAVFGITVLWFTIPMLDPLAAATLNGAVNDFWPSDLRNSGQYLLSNVVPVIMSVGIAVAMWSRIADAKSRVASPRMGLLEAHFHRYASLLLTIILVCVLFDFLQALFDYGNFRAGAGSSLLGFLAEFLPFYLLHSFISVLICSLILFHLDARLSESPRASAPAALAVLLVSVAVLSAFYAAARLRYQFANMAGLDFIVLITVINLTSATLAFFIASVVSRRRLSLNGETRVALPVAGPGRSALA